MSAAEEEAKDAAGQMKTEAGVEEAKETAEEMKTEAGAAEGKADTGETTQKIIPKKPAKSG